MKYRKILMLILFACVLSQGVGNADFKRNVLGEVTCIKSKPPRTLEYGFLLVPRKLIVTSDRSEIVLSLVLMPEFHFQKAELKATNTHGRTSFTFSKSLKKFMKSLNLKKSNFKPFKTYLKSQIKSARTNPEPFIGILDGYLKTGAAPVFSIDLGS